jgi:hypothetical protein
MALAPKALRLMGDCIKLSQLAVFSVIDTLCMEKDYTSAKSPPHQRNEQQYYTVQDVYNISL